MCKDLFIQNIFREICMDSEEIMAPKLIDPSSAYFVSNALTKSHKTRINAFMRILNIGILVGFCIFTFIVLWMCWKNKDSPQKAYEKMVREQEYVLSKIRYYKDHQKYLNAREHATITGLPTTDLRPL